MKKLDFQNEFEKIIDRNYSSKKDTTPKEKSF